MVLTKEVLLKRHDCALNIREQKGFTLLEIVVSIAVIGILATVFFSLFSFGFVGISSVGSKDNAIAQASKLLEQLYGKQGEDGFSEGKIITILEENNGKHVENKEDLYEYEVGEDIVFFIEEVTPFEGEEDIIVDEVTIVVFYQNGARHATLTSFFRRDE